MRNRYGGKDYGRQHSGHRHCRGHAIECPVYDFTIHNRSEQTIHIVPKKVIIVEGILIFENEELRNLMDIRIFVDTDADIRLCQNPKPLRLAPYPIPPLSY